MMSSQTQNALGELMRMVGHIPSSNSNNNSSQPNSNQQLNRKTSPHQNQQINNRLVHQQNGFKPMKPLERKTTTKQKSNGLLPNGLLPNTGLIPNLPTMSNNQQQQTMDPRLFFPAAFTPNGMPKAPAQQMLQMPMFSPMTPFQMTPETLAMMGMGQWPMEAMMQQPTILNKLYSNYAACVQQQQYLQSLVLQSATQNSQNCIKINESPKITPPSSNPSLPSSNLDPLASLHNMVHSSQTKQSNGQTESMPKLPTTEETKMEENDEDEEIIVDVGTTEPLIKLEEKAQRLTPPQSAPPKIATSSSFSIAEILHSSSSTQLDLFQSRTLTPVTVPLSIGHNSPSIPSSSSSSSQNSEPITDSQIENQGSQCSPTLKRLNDFGPDNKKRMAQRKKHVEFHRRMKGISARGKFSQCQICGEIVDNNSSELTNHVYSHSKGALFGCLRCESGFKQKVDHHNHSKQMHPSETLSDHDQFNDLRDMGKLCDLLEKCFPRNSKLVIDTLLNKLLKTCKGSDSLRCQLCDKDVPSNVTSLKNHLNQHPKYRCKLCHYTNEDECEQLKHGKEQHQSDQPIYNVTSASIVLSGILSKCFSDYMPMEQQEFCEEMAAQQESPQGSPQQSIASNGKSN